jgi:excisionase family DNA binding protein
MHTIRSAAMALGTAKSTIYRAVKAGRLPALKLTNGTYAIYPGELRRAFPRATAFQTTDEERTVRAIPAWDVS